MAVSARPTLPSDWQPSAEQLDSIAANAAALEAQAAEMATTKEAVASQGTDLASAQENLAAIQGDYLKAADIADFATKDALTALETSLGEKGDAIAANTTEIDTLKAVPALDVSGFATKDELAGYAKAEDLTSLGTALADAEASLTSRLSVKCAVTRDSASISFLPHPLPFMRGIHASFIVSCPSLD